MNKINVIDSKTHGNTRIEILEYDRLLGSADPGISEKLYFASQMGIKLRQVRIQLNNSAVVTEAGALHYSHGRITSENKLRQGGFARKILNAKLNNESLFRPTFTGVGEVFLDPSFRHFKIYEMNNEELILDEGMFYCATDGLEISITTVKNISSAIFGSDGLTQTVVRGTGLLVLEIPVPFSELRVINLQNSELRVDGKFAIMRTGGIQFSVTTSSKGLIRSWLGGNGLVEMFKGTGQVWLAPTAEVYQGLSAMGGYAPPNLMNSSTPHISNSANQGGHPLGSGSIRNLFGNNNNN